MHLHPLHGRTVHIGAADPCAVHVRRAIAPWLHAVVRTRHSALGHSAVHTVCVKPVYNIIIKPVYTKGSAASEVVCAQLRVWRMPQLSGSRSPCLSRVSPRVHHAGGGAATGVPRRGAQRHMAMGSDMLAGTQGDSRVMRIEIGKT